MYSTRTSFSSSKIMYQLTLYQFTAWQIQVGVDCLCLCVMASAAQSFRRLVFYLCMAVFAVTLGLVTLLLQLIRNPILFFKRTRRDTPPACLLDPTLGTHEYVQANGIKFHYVTCGDKSKPLVLFLHGFPEVSCLGREGLGWVPGQGFRMHP